MITDRDITKLKSVFATKDDLDRFATKDDLKPITVGISGLEMRMYRLEGQIGGLEHRMVGLDNKMDGVMVTVSGIAENYETLRNGTAAGDHILGRHTRQLEALSAGTGIRLPD